MKIIIWDLEVFKYDFLFGSTILSNGTETLFQTWDKEKVKQFYLDNKKDSIFVGYNNLYYDNIVLEAVIRGKNPFEKSKEIIEAKGRPWCSLDFYSYDVMNTGFAGSYSLKLTELIRGISIDTTEVDFNLDRPLTDEEKRLTEKYNKADLDATLYNFRAVYDRFELRLNMAKEWNLPLKHALEYTEAQLAAEVLEAKKNPALAFDLVKPKMYDNLIIENKQVKEFYLTEKFRTDCKEIVTIGNAELTMGHGGLHSAMKKAHFDRLLYLDVSGYYNLVMINFNLLSRAIPESGHKRYEEMYHQQLELKKTDPDSPKRKSFKTILLAVFGAQQNDGSAMCDPQVGSLVPVTGELFLIDLLEKIYNLCTIAQSNTDGIMIEPNNEECEKKILEILDGWLKRTGFVIKPKYIYNLFQRDVNNYLYQDSKGNLEVKGEALKNYDISDKAYSAAEIFNSKEPPIIARGIVEALVNGKMPEETVEEYKNDLRWFQYACKKGTYKYLTYDVTYSDGSTSSEVIDHLCRAFAWKNDNAIGMLNKHKFNFKKNKEDIAKVACLPDSVFVYNKEILSEETRNKLSEKIDWDYYIKRIYERIEEFI